MRKIVSGRYLLTMLFVLTNVLPNAFGELDNSKLIEVNASNKAKCVEFYIVENKLMCSTVRTLSDSVGADTLQHEKFQIVFDNRQWVPGWGKHDPSITTVEYVPKGENVDSWNELITTQFQPGKTCPFPPIGYATWLKEDLNKRGYSPDVIVHSHSPSEILFEFKIKEPKEEAQDEIQRMIVGKEGLYFIHYVIRQTEMTPENLTKWLTNIKQAAIK